MVSVTRRDTAGTTNGFVEARGFRPSPEPGQHEFQSDFAVILFAGLVLLSGSRALTAAELTAKIVDHDTGEPLAARVYMQSADGEWLFVQAAHPDGSAVPYREQWVPMPNSVERHTTVSEHGFRIGLQPGQYDITIERGKDYLTHTDAIEVGRDDLTRTFRLRRWVDPAARGWYSGETHVHRRIHELPNVMLAEDLNVAFPVTFWTIESDTPPGLTPSPLRRQGPSPFGPREDRGADPISVDSTHVIYPRNTEYEIFSIAGKRHVLGAMFILNHKTAFDTGAPPIGPIAKQAHAEGALLDLDKHSWPWSMMLVPVAGIDLYELSNNSVWRTEFGFRRSGLPIPDYMQIKTENGLLTERGWLEYGFQNYYTLLNCGFRLKPTAGTASGVHPVPLGHSRVYVHVDGSFTGDKWIAGLGAGRSFVTTGPMLYVTVDGRHPGAEFTNDLPATHDLEIECVAPTRGVRIELIQNGRIVRSFTPEPEQRKNDGFTYRVHERRTITRSSWIAVRAFAPHESGRERFAHTGPFFSAIADKPLRPRREEIESLIKRVSDEIERNRDVLSEAALAEFRQALQHYRAVLSTAVH